MRGSGEVVRLVAVVAALGAASASAQCTKDTDCKGERICAKGECVAPQGTAAATPAPLPAVAPAPLAPAPSAVDFANRPMLLKPSHWAHPAGVTGLVMGSLVVGFGVLSAVFNGDTVPSVSMGVLALLCGAIGAPIVAIGGSSARFDDSVTGSPGTRVVGWVGYGLAMALGAVMVVLGIEGVTFTNGLILAVAGLGASSLACLAVDAFTAAGQADELIARLSPRAERPRLAPFLTLSRRPDGALAPVLGFAVEL